MSRKDKQSTEERLKQGSSGVEQMMVGCRKSLFFYLSELIYGFKWYRVELIALLFGGVS